MTSNSSYLSHDTQATSVASEAQLQPPAFASFFDLSCNSTSSTTHPPDTTSCDLMPDNVVSLPFAAYPTASSEKQWAAQIFQSLGLTSRAPSEGPEEKPKIMRVEELFDPFVAHGLVKRSSVAEARSSEVGEPTKKETSLAPGTGKGQLTKEVRTTDVAVSNKEQGVPDPLSTYILTQRTALFFEHLYSALCPGIFPRAYVYPRLGKNWHQRDPSFASLVLSMSILGQMLLKPSPQNESGFNPPVSKRSLTSEDRIEIVRLISHTINLRSLSEGIASFGQEPCCESIMTSFFLSMALWALDEDRRWRGASLTRFSEAVTLARILRVDDLAAHEIHRSSNSQQPKPLQEEQVRRLRIWALLVRAEKWWSSQQCGYRPQLWTPEAAARVPIEAKSAKRQRSPSIDEAVEKKPRYLPYRKAQELSSNPRPDFGVLNSALPSRSHWKEIQKAEASAPLLTILSELGYEPSRTKLLEILDPAELLCWHGGCDKPCTKLDHTKALRIHDSLLSLEYQKDILLDLVRQALRCRLWQSSYEHGLVQQGNSQTLRPDQPLHVGLDTLDILDDLYEHVSETLGDQKLHICALLHEIASCIRSVSESQFQQEAFILEEDVTGSSDEGEGDDEQENADSTFRESVSVTAEKTTTTIQQGSRAILFDLERFCQQLFST